MLTETKSIACYDYLDSMEAWEEKLIFERWIIENFEEKTNSHIDGRNEKTSRM